ncbi:DNA/RNA non-specific endonuclease [Sorangium sp. So ce260]|uniref:DNA/RNA non-specific endonuclease n=1 Tax=Sorangium sp. So ce260 TaxID=3133291 RepID=UPI003F610F1F
MIPHDEAVYAEIELALGGNRPLPPSLRHRSRAAVSKVLAELRDRGGAIPVDESVPAPVAAAPASADEAIVRLYGRPSMLIQSDRIVPPESDEWRRRLGIFRPLVEPAVRSVARVRLENSDRLDWAGTAWMIAKNVAITNRHVAEEFAFATSDKPVPRTSAANGQPIKAYLDFGSDPASIRRDAEVRSVLYMASPGAGEPDLALLEIAGNRLPDPIELGDDADEDEWVGVIGYPAYDTRNGHEAQARIFDDLYEVKRFAPGKVMQAAQANIFAHDASTLGGNSGSPVMSLRTGKAVGLHFSGRYLQANFAVKASKIRAILDALKISTPVREPVLEDVFMGDEADNEARRRGDTAHGPSYFEGREGFDPAFLGADYPVEWPDMSAWAQDLAPLRVPGKKEPHRLDYTHFSIVMSASRRMPIVTAVNIDGSSSLSIQRDKDVWFLDGRLDARYQIGNDEAYNRNSLDRGHMVRREDPNWGDGARQANLDTFHYTNSVPQHAKLNQRTWLELEKYVLDAARASSLKATVFTGPVLREDDFPYREILIPAEFYKVVVVVDGETSALEATGYLQSQTDHLGDDLDEGVFDGGSTYQVPISYIEEITGLRFGLSAHDPMENSDESRGPRGFRGRRIRRPADIRVRR